MSNKKKPWKLAKPRQSLLHKKPMYLLEGPGIVGDYEDWGFTEDSAKRIVQCVNAHDELVAALREAYLAFAHDDEGPVWAASTIAKARAALAKAGVKV